MYQLCGRAGARYIGFIIQKYDNKGWRCTRSPPLASDQAEAVRYAPRSDVTEVRRGDWLLQTVAGRGGQLFLA